MSGIWPSMLNGDEKPISAAPPARADGDSTASVFLNGSVNAVPVSCGLIPLLKSPSVIAALCFSSCTSSMAELPFMSVEGGGVTFNFSSMTVIMPAAFHDSIDSSL